MDRSATVVNRHPSPSDHVLAPDAALLPTIPGYEIIDLLGQGGMGIVFKAWNTGLRRPAAVKVLHRVSAGNVEDLLRFRWEAEAVARLEHPNIIKLHEIGQSPQPYIVLEYAEGGNLASQLDGRPLPPRDAAHLIETLAFSPDGRCLATATEQGCLYLWDPVTGNQRVQLIEADSRIVQMAFAPDGSSLAVAFLEGRARIWHTR